MIDRPGGLAGPDLFTIMLEGRALGTLPDRRGENGDRVDEGVDTSISVKGIITPQKYLSDASLFLKILSPGRNSICAPQGLALGGPPSSGGSLKRGET